MVEEALAYGFRRDRLMWMPNPVDTDEFKPGSADEVISLRRETDLPENAKVIVYTGRLAPEKGLPNLLRAFALVSCRMRDALLLLVGDGPLRTELEDVATGLGLSPEKIRFIGKVPSTLVSRWLRLADVFALLSPSEGFSCALAEAMASGLPSVVCDIPANTQLVEPGVHGYLVPAGNPHAAAEAMLLLLGDAALRRRIGEASRRKVQENFAMSRVAERYEALFAELRQ
jgi:glycosyltransferase involved in cell wall biosynthesis